MYGWNDSTPALLEALREHADLEAVAIGDERPAALVRARSATSLPGFQHVREMARKAEFDRILIGEGSLASEVAESAAARGADLLLVGAVTDADTLERAALAAQRYGVRLDVFRPWLLTDPVTALAARLERRTPALLTMEVSAPRAPLQSLRDLVALSLRLMRTRVLDASATQAGDPFEGAPLTAHLRLASGHVVVLTARMALRPVLRVLASDEDGMLEIRAREDTLDVEEHRAGGEVSRESMHLRQTPAHDWLNSEAQRIAEPTNEDLELAPGEAATLRAIEVALEGAFAERVDVAPRPFQLLRGGAREASPSGPRPTGISLVTAP